MNRTILYHYLASQNENVQKLSVILIISSYRRFFKLSGSRHCSSTHVTGCFYQTFIQAEITTASDELATAVYYETDKAFPSNAISSHESAFDDKFQIIAGKIAGNADSVQQSPDSKPEEASLLLATLHCKIYLLMLC